MHTILPALSFILVALSQKWNGIQFRIQGGVFLVPCVQLVWRIVEMVRCMYYIFVRMPRKQKRQGMTSLYLLLGEKREKEIIKKQGE